MSTDFNFPKTPDEAEVWQPVIKYVSLGHMVVASAQTRIEGKWAAYIGAVCGKNHDVEFLQVLENGDKLPKEIAIVLFPEFASLPYAR